MGTAIAQGRVVTARPGYNKGWRVTFAGTGVNLALGVLYAWSVIAGYLRADLGWTAMQSQIPYMIACGVFALLMVPGGRMQDKIGPRTIIMAAAIFAGIGFIGSATFLSVAGLAICFGVFFGTAMGLGYSSTTPPAMKWFAPGRRGLVTGLVVSGFGVAAVYAAPLADFLIGRVGMQQTFLVFGAGAFAFIMLMSQFIANPPAGYVPPGTGKQPEPEAKKEAPRPAPAVDYEWHEMVRTPRFYLLWAMFCFGSLAGLMVIGQLASIAVDQSGAAMGFMLVAVLAVFNAAGRIGGGILFDRIGQTRTLLLIFGVQAVNFIFFNTYVNPLALLIGTVVAGTTYGACLSVFPATTASLFGVKNLGVNYGLVFTAWGAGGVFGGLTGGLVRDMTGSYLNAYLIAAALCLIGIVLTLLLAANGRKRQRALTPAPAA